MGGAVSLKTGTRVRFLLTLYVTQFNTNELTLILLTPTY